MLLVSLSAPSKGLFFPVVVLTIVCTLCLIYLASRADVWPIDTRIAHLLSRTRNCLPFGSFPRPDTLSVLLYCAGIAGSVGGYSYLALTSSGITLADEISGWGLLDKRPIVFGYVVVVAFIAYHWLVVGIASNGRHRPQQTVDCGGRAGSFDEKTIVRWMIKCCSGVLIAFLAYWWVGLPALRNVDVGGGSPLANFFEFHNNVQLGAMEQIRLGAAPYLEAQTQYGVGNQQLMYLLINAVNYSSHGFYAASTLLDVACVIGFFVFLQQILGLGWAIAGLVGWLLWPSPHNIIDLLPGWAILTRWLAIPVLSLLLAHLLLNANSYRHPWIAASLAGVVWGVGGFLSQESLSGGFLVFALSTALFAPASGMRLRALVGISVAFMGCGTAIFAATVAHFVGISHCVEAFQMANKKADLVMAGLSNSWWSENLDLSVNAYRQLEPIFQTYGFAILLILSIGLLAKFLGRRWKTAADKERRFAWKFAGVAVGACVLHLFTLLRSDLSHLSGSSFLLPLFLIMLPPFVWRCVTLSRTRHILLIVSLGIVLDAVIVDKFAVIRNADGIGTIWRDSANVLEVYRELRSYKSPSPDLAARYSPIPRYQVAFRNHQDYEEAQELFELLHDRLRGRPIELAFYKVDELIGYPELFYFIGGFRAVSGITSPLTSIWLRSEQDAWINAVVGTKNGCVLFEPNPRGRLFEVWMNSAQQPNSVITEPIVGKRLYGMLSCRA